MKNIKIDPDSYVELSDSLIENAKDISGEVNLHDLLTEDFMKSNTRFESLENMFTSGGFVVKSSDDFANISINEFDAHIAKNSEFSSWNELLGKAAGEYISGRLL